MWKAIQRRPTGYDATAGWEAAWQGEGPRPHGPYGEQVGVFNTTQRKAQGCCDYFNEQIASGQTN